MNNLHALLAGPVRAVLPAAPVASVAWDVFVKLLDSWGWVLGFLLLMYLCKWRTRANLHDLAHRLGYNYKPVDGSADLTGDASEVTGTHRGRVVRFYAHQNPGGKNHAWIAVAASISANKIPAGAFLYVVPNTWSFRTDWRLAPLGTVRKEAIIPRGWDVNWKEMQNLAIGDETFDRAFLIKTNQPDWAKTLLTYDVCQRLLAKRQERWALIGLQNDPSVVSLCIQVGEVRYSVPGDFGSARQVNHLIAQMDFVCDLAAQAEAPSQHGLVSTPLPRQSMKSSFPSVRTAKMGTEAKSLESSARPKRSLQRLIASIVIALVFTLLVEVVPAIEKSYESSHTKPSAPTQAIIDVSHFWVSWWWALLLAGFGVRKLFKRATSSPSRGIPL
jgi:hypothetical protein